MSKQWDPENVFDVFGDDLARRILVLTSERPLSAEELSEYLEVSPPTVYRRVNALSEHDLLRERTEIDADGTQYQVFETTLQRIAFEIEEGGYTVDVTLRQSLVDQFESFWSDLEDASPRFDLETELDLDGTPEGSNHE